MLGFRLVIPTAAILLLSATIGRAADPAPVSKETIAAYEKLRFFSYGAYTQNRAGFWGMEYRPAAAGELPCFHSNFFEPTASLPDVGVPFALVVHVSVPNPPFPKPGPSQRKSPLRHLLALKNLHTLDVTFGYLTDESLDDFRAIRELKSVSRIRVRFEIARDVAMPQLKALQGVENVRELSFGEIADYAIKPLGELTQLTDLQFDKGPNESGLDSIQGLKNLTSLRLGFRPLSSKALATVGANFPKLTTLKGGDLEPGVGKEFAALGNLTRLGVGRVGPEFIEVLPKLSKLIALKADLPGKDLGKLAAIKGLRELDPGTGIDDTSLKELRILPELETLYLRSRGVTDAGMHDVAACQKLKFLDFTNSKVGDVGVKQLAGLKHLDTLESPSVTDEGLKALAGFPALKSLSLGYGATITDSGLAALAKSGTLQRVELLRAGVTQAGVDKLRAAKPGIVVLGTIKNGGVK